VQNGQVFVTAVICSCAVAVKQLRVYSIVVTITIHRYCCVFISRSTAASCTWNHAWRSFYATRKCAQNLL